MKRITNTGNRNWGGSLKLAAVWLLFRICKNHEEISLKFITSLTVKNDFILIQTKSTLFNRESSWVYKLLKKKDVLLKSWFILWLPLRTVQNSNIWDKNSLLHKIRLPENHIFILTPAQFLKWPNYLCWVCFLAAQHKPSHNKEMTRLWVVFQKVPENCRSFS